MVRIVGRRGIPDVDGAVVDARQPGGQVGGRPGGVGEGVGADLERVLAVAAEDGGRDAPFALARFRVRPEVAIADVAAAGAAEEPF